MIDVPATTLPSDGTLTLAMHIPDNFISPSTSAVFWVVMIPIWALCLRSVMREATPERMAYLGAGAAFSFLVMMFNVPTPGGTTAHGVGGALIALLLGPQYATVAVSVALLLQALLFGDGGLLTLGANCFNMAVVLPFVAYGLAAGVRRLGALGVRGDRRAARNRLADRVGAFAGGYVGLCAAALCVALELGVQPLLFRAANGQALYFPFPIAVTVPAMLIPHLAVAGVVEGLITVVVVGFVRDAAPEAVRAWGTRATAGEAAGADGDVSARAGVGAVVGAVVGADAVAGAVRPAAAVAGARGVRGSAGSGVADVRGGLRGGGLRGGDSSSGAVRSDDSRSDAVRSGGSRVGLRRRALRIGLAVVALLSPLGLLAAGDAWGEWGAEDFMAATGLDYVPQYIAHGFTWNALLPDYSLRGLPDAAGYVLSAVIGVAVLTIVFRLLAAAARGGRSAQAGRGAA
ncbi:cobalt transporter CbiM [Bifidobacterium leontopitheci]|uniref:Cobalt transport protein CbiM n=1 Tax=Bifidobacterium leontopitheci TaxID=2650774 RepID=A0A6I1GKN8_9BIFI|nr:cobalt transporter CbiM [Bifidobacterium leontopitheci]KAB7789937.1 cobalt transport protein CbiM [Bifidobacterium leontopitheci]